MATEVKESEETISFTGGACSHKHPERHLTTDDPVCACGNRICGVCHNKGITRCHDCQQAARKMRIPIPDGTPRFAWPPSPGK